MADCSEEIIAKVAAARADHSAVYIRAGNTKRNIIGRCCDAQELNVFDHSGVIQFQPSELVITARAGTPVAELEQTLAEESLILPFEPPTFSGRATLGGTLASNLSGPSRPWGGSIRDAVLGVQLINGKAELLNFGGTVMKNVAGYDVSRLQAGALGTLGVLTQISLRVRPAPERVLSLAFQMPPQDAIGFMNEKAGQSKPITGGFWADGVTHLRLAGADAAVEQTAKLWGGERISQDTGPWAALREMELPFFSGDKPLWRISQKASANHFFDGAEQVIDWCGAQRWLRGEQDRDALARAAADAGGHVTLFSGGDRYSEVRHALSTAEQGLQTRLKKAFDPDSIFNPGRLYSWM